MALISCYTGKQLTVIHQTNHRFTDDQKATYTYSDVPESFRRLFEFVTNTEVIDRDQIKKPNEITMKVITRPNPFLTSVTLDVTCDQNKHIIVRMFDEGGKIIKMLSWYVMKGSNVTSIKELNVLDNGQYFLDIIDTEGTVLFNTMLSKQ
jgi:hypothetical protein